MINFSSVFFNLICLLWISRKLKDKHFLLSNNKQSELPKIVVFNPLKTKFFLHNSKMVKQISLPNTFLYLHYPCLVKENWHFKTWGYLPWNESVFSKLFFVRDQFLLLTRLLKLLQFKSEEDRIKKHKT